MATLTVEILVGVILIVSAIMHATHAFQVRRWRNITWEAVFAVLFFITGILFLVYPFSGMMALTILLGLFFLIYGGFKIPLALSWKPRPGWGWIMTSGILTVILGLILIIGLPGTAVWAIGLILGIDLIFTGATLLALGSKLKSLAHG
jgi:uncharacterized membrane protein HdeD (DUF308 family)